MEWQLWSASLYKEKESVFESSVRLVVQVGHTNVFGSLLAGAETKSFVGSHALACRPVKWSIIDKRSQFLPN